MTIVNIKNDLLTHFLTCSTFNLEDDLGSVKIDDSEGSDFKENHRAIVKFTLNELVKLGIVAMVSESLYVLIQPLNQLNQSVIVSPVTALMIADLVNSFTSQTGEQKETGYIVNKLAITDQDIAAICRICHTIIGADAGPDKPTKKGKS